MSELPQGWAEVPLLDIIELHDNRRIPLNSTERATKQGDYPYYGANGLVDHISDYIFDGHYVLLAEDGGNFDKPERGVAYEAEGQFWVNNHAHILAPVGGMSPRFLRNLLNSINWMPHVGGSTRLKLTQAGMAQVRAPLPPLPEQRRIVAKVDGLTARTARARKELDRIPTLIARYKQRLLALAFSGELFSDLNHSVAFEPRVLEEVILSTFYGPRFGKDAYVTDGVPTLRTTDFDSAGNIALKNPPQVAVLPEEYVKWGLLDGDLLVTRTGSIGKCALYSEKIGLALPSAYLIRVRLDQAEILPKYALLFLLSGEGQRQLGAGITAVAQPNINAKVISGLQLAIPPLEIQAEIVRRIESAFGWLDRMAADHAAAARLLPKLDAAILGKAFQGKLVVQDPNDEPAARLLERVKAEREAEAKKPKSGRGRKPNGTKAQGMKEKTLPPRDRLLKDSEGWPLVGLPFEAIAMRNSIPHDALRDALFELLSGPSPALQQRFDTDAEVMVIQRVVV